MPRKRQALPWVDRHTNDVFYVFWYDAEKRRTCRETLSTTDEAEARTRFATWLVKGSRASRVVGPAGVTVTQALDWYDHQHVGPNVVDKQRQRDAIAHLKTFMGTRALASIDIATSRAYAAARRSGEVGGGKRRTNKVGSDGTIRRELNVLVSAGAHALRWKRITASELPQVELPPEPRTARVKWLTKDQIRDALAAARSGRLHDFILLAYYWGARRESVERLLKSQVDLRHGVVDLHPPGSPVTRKRKPKVPIYPEIRPTIERLMADGTSPFLLGAGTSVYRDFVLLMERLGIEAWPHQLRHSRASHMMMDGEDPYKVAKLLGDTLATVERVYGHHDEKFLATKSNLGAA